MTPASWSNGGSAAARIVPGARRRRAASAAKATTLRDVLPLVVLVGCLTTGSCSTAHHLASVHTPRTLSSRVTASPTTVATPSSSHATPFPPDSIRRSPIASAVAPDLPPDATIGRRSATQTPNQLALLPGCPAGVVLSAVRVAAITVRLMSDKGVAVNLCLTLPDGRVVHPGPGTGQRGGYGVGVDRFPDGSEFKTDSLGHVFVGIQPGQITGITVIIPAGTHTRVLGPFAGGRTEPAPGAFVIHVVENDCTPHCSDGHTTQRNLHWMSNTGDYR